MRKFVKSIRTSKYIIGCTGRTTYIYDLNEQLILKFQDIPYGYTPYVSKDEKYLCVKATGKNICFYDLDSLTLIKKITIKKDDSQDCPGAFMDDGRFVNIEYTKALLTDIVIYEKDTFEEIKRYSFEEKFVFTDLNIIDDVIFLMGYKRVDNGIQHMDFKLENDILTYKEISNEEYRANSQAAKRFEENLKKDIEAAKSLGIDLSGLINLLNWESGDDNETI